jgi:C-terminal processing protease CtpA/Prc
VKSESYFISKDIAYLTFNAFQPADLNSVLNNYEKVRKSKGLIIDFRGNDGGSIGAMKLFLGRFVSERKKYVTYINRDEENEDFIDPTGNTFKGKIVVLVDEMSISGAENSSLILQQLNSATIIGNQTPGQLLWGNLYQINDTVSLVIPIYKLEYPNGYNPENNGITPDIEIELNRKDLLNGKDTQLERAIEYLTNEYVLRQKL